MINKVQATMICISGLFIFLVAVLSILARIFKIKEIPDDMSLSTAFCMVLISVNMIGAGWEFMNKDK